VNPQLLLELAKKLGGNPETSLQGRSRVLPPNPLAEVNPNIPPGVRGVDPNGISTPLHEPPIDVPPTGTVEDYMRQIDEFNSDGPQPNWSDPTSIPSPTSQAIRDAEDDALMRTIEQQAEAMGEGGINFGEELERQLEHLLQTRGLSGRKLK